MHTHKQDRSETSRRWRGLSRDEGGVTAVEFAILGVPFFAIVAAILQTSLVFLSGQILESAVSDASRAIRTGQAQKSSATINDFRADVCDRLFGLFSDCSKLYVNVIEVTNFQSATTSVPIDPDCTSDCTWTDNGTWKPGGGQSIVMVQVYYRYPVIVQLGPFGISNLADGSRLLGAFALFQNEPFT